MQNANSTTHLAEVIQNLDELQARLTHLFDRAPVVGGNRTASFLVRTGLAAFDVQAIEASLHQWAQTMGTAAEQRSIVRSLSLGASLKTDDTHRVYEVAMGYYQVSRVSGCFHSHS